MAIRDDAYQDWKNGMKAKALSDKYGVSINTTKSWITRWRKKEPESEGAPKRVHTFSERVHPKKRGGQPGNSNAEGNKGGAPPGNQNSVKHGFYVQALSEEEQALLAGRKVALEDELKEDRKSVV